MSIDEYTKYSDKLFFYSTNGYLCIDEKIS